MQGYLYHLFTNEFKKASESCRNDLKNPFSGSQHLEYDAHIKLLDAARKHAKRQKKETLGI